MLLMLLWCRLPACNGGCRLEARTTIAEHGRDARAPRGSWQKPGAGLEGCSRSAGKLGLRRWQHGRAIARRVTVDGTARMSIWSDAAMAASAAVAAAAAPASGPVTQPTSLPAGAETMGPYVFLGLVVFTFL